MLKTNGLTDPTVIDALYRASQAGVPVDLIVRERCCLRPGVPGLSDRIRVRSIVGRYLEHSRLFRFGGEGDRPVRVWIGSADLMERNLDRRVEVIVPIDDPELQARVVGMLDDALRDEANSWVLGPDAAWTRLAGSDPAPLGFSLQDHLERQALESLRHAPRRLPEPTFRPSRRSRTGSPSRSRRHGTRHPMVAAGAVEGALDPHVRTLGRPSGRAPSGPPRPRSGSASPPAWTRPPWTIRR